MNGEGNRKMVCAICTEEADGTAAYCAKCGGRLQFESVALDGVSGQDRESYSDDQDRESYAVAGELKMYELVWRQCPHDQHPGIVARVQAANKDDAKTLLTDAVRGRGVHWFTIQHCKEYVKPDVPGRVLHLGTEGASI